MAVFQMVCRIIPEIEDLAPITHPDRFYFERRNFNSQLTGLEVYRKHTSYLEKGLPGALPLVCHELCRGDDH